MAIADVIRLKKLRATLAGWDWTHSGGLDCMRFFTDDGRSTHEHSLSEDQRKDVGEILNRVERSGSHIAWCWSRAAAEALKRIVLERLDLAIKEAAEEARKEAEEVLAELGD